MYGTVKKLTLGVFLVLWTREQRVGDVEYLRGLGRSWSGRQRDGDHPVDAVHVSNARHVAQVGFLGYHEQELLVPWVNSKEMRIDTRTCHRKRNQRQYERMEKSAMIAIDISRTNG